MDPKPSSTAPDRTPAGTEEEPGTRDVRERERPPLLIRIITDQPWLLFLLAVVVVFALSSIPLEKLLKIRRFDKEFHFLEYLVLGLVLLNLLTRSFRKVTWVSLLLGFMVLLGIGVLDEFYQYWVPGRTPDRDDLFSSTLGSFSAMVVSLILARWIANRPPPS